jgi:hypothetical protein
MRRLCPVLIVLLATLGAAIGHAASVEIDLDAIANPGVPKLRPPRGVAPPAVMAEQEAVLTPPAPIAGPTADALFVLAYGLERQGRTLEAAARYRQLLAVFPNEAAAPLAAERLDGLQQAAAAALPPLLAPAPAAGPEPGQRVCSLPTLYPNRSRWCGLIRRIQGEGIEVELDEISAHGLFAIGLKASPCTGNRWLDRSAAGTRIAVPASCVASP